MWHIALVVLGVVAGIFLAAMLSAVWGMERTWRKGASGGNTQAAGETAPAVERAEPVEVDANSGIGAGAVAPENTPPAKELWIDSEYCWVVICKNHLFHKHPNLYNVHRIPLGQTDAVTPCPSIKKAFSVRCDECKKEYFYKPAEVLRWEMAPPPSFEPHALFK